MELSKNELISSIEKRLEKKKSLPHFASSLGYDIYYLFSNYNLSLEEQNKIKMKYFQCLSQWGLSNLLDNQLNYALRLIKSEGYLEYEEIHKIFSLSDEISALINLGVEKDDKLVEEFIFSFREFLKKEPHRSRLVAEDKLEDWKKLWWWYNFK